MITSKELMLTEIKLINKFLQTNRIRARVIPALCRCIEVAYLEYGLEISPQEKLKRVEEIQRELRVALASNRKRLGISGETTLFLQFNEAIALQVSHPFPKLLRWNPNKITCLEACSGLVGRSYGIEPRDEILSLRHVPHALIVGTTGAGKSMLLQHFLFGLMSSTSPEELRIYLIDLKNEDLLPFAHLPHVVKFAGIPEEADKVIEAVTIERDLRVLHSDRKPFRILLVVDEMADLSGEALENLEKILQIGRSKHINVIASTQSPTEKGGLGAMLRANFRVRLVGMVAPGQSHIATNRPKTFAELLSVGSFLWIEGNRLDRFQSFYFPEEDVKRVIAEISAKWGGSRVVEKTTIEAATRVATRVATSGYKGGYGVATSGYKGGYGGGYKGGYEGGYLTNTPGKLEFPLKKLNLTKREEIEIVKLALSSAFQVNGQPSLRKLVSYVFGSRNGERTKILKELLRRRNIL